MEASDYIWIGIMYICYFCVEREKNQSEHQDMNVWSRLDVTEIEDVILIDLQNLSLLLKNVISTKVAYWHKY